MGRMLRMVCPKCGFCYEFVSGIGMNSYDRAIEFREKCLSGKVDSPLTELFRRYPKDGIVWFSRELYQCPSCLQLQQHEDQTFWKENLPGDDVVVRPWRPVCSKCHVEMLSDHFRCPECGTSLVEEVCGMWD